MPDPMNPQSLNRYAYCLNNPLKYTDPMGLDVILVGGSGQSESDLQEYYNYLVDEGIIDGAEPFVLLPDIDPGSGLLNFIDIDAGPRLVQLMKELVEGNHKDIKLLGFSEGAAAVGSFLSTLADYPGILSEDVRAQLRAAVLLECPAGGAPDFVTSGFNRGMLANLPKRLTNAGINMKLADVWNKASIVHGGKLEGWGKQSKPYDSRPWWERGICNVAEFFGQGDLVDASRAARTSSLHTNVLKNKNALKVIKETFYK